MDVKLTEKSATEINGFLGIYTMPKDRVVSVHNGFTYLYDTQFKITDEMIEEIINGD